MKGTAAGAVALAEKHMSWIGTVPYEQSTGTLRTLYDRVRGPGGAIDNILRVHR